MCVCMYKIVMSSATLMLSPKQQPRGEGKSVLFHIDQLFGSLGILRAGFMPHG